MRKLNPSPANIRSVADALARDLGGRDKVLLKHVRDLVEGPPTAIQAILEEWFAGIGESDATPEYKDIIGDLRRDLLAALKTEAPQPEAVRDQGPVAQRNATASELKAVVRASTSEEETHGTKSYLRHVWARRPDPDDPKVKAAAAAKSRAKAQARSKARRKRLRSEEAERRRRVDRRLRALKEEAGAEAAPKMRRPRKADWSGASNRFVAGFAASALRQVGFPLTASEIAEDMLERGGPELRYPATQLIEAIEGSRMKVVGRHGQIWFDGEVPPERPATERRRDTTNALARQQGDEMFGRAIEALRAAAPASLTIADLEETLGAVEGFDRDGQLRRLLRAAADPASGVHDQSGRFTWAGDPDGEASESARGVNQ